MLAPLADELGLAHVATGTNADDARRRLPPRHPRRRRAGAVTPLLDAGLTKADVRTASRELGPGHLGQAGRRLPVEPDRLRHRGHRGPAVAGRARGDRAAAARLPTRASPYGTCGFATSATARASRSTASSSARWPRPAGLLGAVEGFDAVELDPLGFRSRRR